MVQVDKSIENKGRKIMVTEPLKMTLLIWGGRVFLNCYRHEYD